MKSDPVLQAAMKYLRKSHGKLADMLEPLAGAPAGINGREKRTRILGGSQASQNSSRINEALSEFFHQREDGLKQPKVLRIRRKSDGDPEQKYELVLERRDRLPDPDAPREPANSAMPPANSAEQFWHAYIHADLDVWVVYGIPLFLRRKDGDHEIFIRDMRYNRAGQLQPTDDKRYPFVRRGEVECMLELSRFFAAHRIQVHSKGAKEPHDLVQLLEATRRRKTHIITIGNTYSNGVLKHYQSMRKFPIVQDGAAVTRRADTSATVYELTQRADAEREDLWMDYVLVTRQPGAQRGTVVTSIASDSGTAVSHVGRVLTDAEELQGMLIERGIADLLEPDAPTSFQLVFEVDLVSNREAAVGSRIVDEWTPGQWLQRERAAS